MELLELFGMVVFVLSGVFLISMLCLVFHREFEEQEREHRRYDELLRKSGEREERKK